MTTAAYGGHGVRGHRVRGHGVRPAGSRAVHLAPARLRIVGGSGRLRWWHGRLTLGLTLIGAMIGALAGVALTFLDRGVAPVEMLEAYGATAGVGASAGLVLGLVLGLLLALVDRYLLPQSVRPRQVWQRHRRDS